MSGKKKDNLKKYNKNFTFVSHGGFFYRLFYVYFKNKQS